MENNIVISRYPAGILKNPSFFVLFAGNSDFVGEGKLFFEKLTLPIF